MDASNFRFQIGKNRSRLRVMNMVFEQAGFRIRRVVSPGHNHAGNTEEYQRHRHERRRLTSMFVNMMVAGCAGEGHVPHAEHIKRRDARGSQRQQKEQQMTRVCVHEA